MHCADGVLDRIEWRDFFCSGRQAPGTARRARAGGKSVIKGRQAAFPSIASAARSCQFQYQLRRMP